MLVQRTCLPIQETKETQIWSLGLKDPLEEGMATHPTIPAWRVPRTEDPVRLQSMGLPRVGHNWSNSKDACKAVIKEQQHQKKKVYQYHHSRFHIYALIYSICFSLSDGFPCVWYARGSLISLQLTHMHSFSWLCNIPLCISTTTSLSRHLLMDI